MSTEILEAPMLSDEEKVILARRKLLGDKSLGEQADYLQELKTAKEKLVEKASAKQKEIDEAEEILMRKMDEQGTRIVEGKASGFSIQTSEKPQVVDWDAFYRFIARKKYWHLLERRPAVLGCRELWEKNVNKKAQAIPGVVPTQYRKILKR